MCPNSPAMPYRPRCGAPSVTIPPPMPVPSVTQTRWVSPRPAPKRHSAHAAALASFSTTTGRPRTPVSASRSGSSRQARWGANRTRARVGVDEPGGADPDGDDVVRGLELLHDLDDRGLHGGGRLRLRRRRAGGPGRAPRPARRPHRRRPWCRRCRRRRRGSRPAGQVGRADEPASLPRVGPGDLQVRSVRTSRTAPRCRPALAGSSKRSPASLTPPPTTIVAGSSTAASAATPSPSQRPSSAKRPTAAASPASAASVTIVPVTASGS